MQRSRRELITIMPPLANSDARRCFVVRKKTGVPMTDIEDPPLVQHFRLLDRSIGLDRKMRLPGLPVQNV